MERSTSSLTGLLLFFFSYPKFTMQHGVWKTNLHTERIQPLIMGADIAEQREDF